MAVRLTSPTHLHTGSRTSATRESFGTFPDVFSGAWRFLKATFSHRPPLSLYKSFFHFLFLFFWANFVSVEDSDFSFSKSSPKNRKENIFFAGLITAFFFHSPPSHRKSLLYDVRTTHGSTGGWGWGGRGPSSSVASVLLHPNPCMPACLVACSSSSSPSFVLEAWPVPAAGADTHSWGTERKRGSGGWTRPRWPGLNAFFFSPPHLHKQNVTVVFPPDLVYTIFFFSFCLRHTQYCITTLNTPSHLRWLHFLYYFIANIFPLRPRNKFCFKFPHLLGKETIKPLFFSLFISSISFFRSTLPPHSTSLPVSLLLARPRFRLAELCILLMLLCSILEVEAYFPSHVHFRERVAPPAIAEPRRPPPLAVFNSSIGDPVCLPFFHSFSLSHFWNFPLHDCALLSF